jgi:hypothetical protein
MPIVTGPSGNITPVQVPNMVGDYAQLMQLRNAMQNAPIQNQILQQQAQAGQMDVQQKQIQLKDQQAMSAAMQQWGQPKPAHAGGSTQGAPSAPSTMPNYDDLVELAKKNGASFNAIKGLQTSILDMRAKAATIAKDDAQTGASNATAMKTKNGMIVAAMTGVMNLPDEQIAPGLLSVAQELAGKGLLDPQHIQMAQQLAQSGNPASMRQQLDVYAKSLGGFSQMLTDAQKKVELGSKEKELKFYADNGGAPGVSAELMQQSDWLKKNPGKGPSDYKLWVLQHSPTAAVMGNQFTPDAVNLAAQNLLQTGQGPQGMYRSPGTIAGVYNKAAEMNTQQGGAGIAANKAAFQSNEGSLKSLQKNFDQVQAFEQTALSNINLLQSAAQKIPDLGTRFANVPVRMLNSKMIGTENMAAFNTALNTAQTEAAKVLNSSNATGVLSDSARHELQQIIDGNMPYGAMVASLNTLKQDMSNRTAAYQKQITDIQGRIKGAGSPAVAEGATKVNSHGDKIVFKGGQWQIAQ